MKIYITGTTGFIGSNLVDYYDRRGHMVVQHKRGDNLVQELEMHKPDAIINCAAEIYDADSMFFPNIQLVEQCLQHVKKWGGRMIQLGSSSEYGPTNHPTAENTLLKPVDFYQGTKAAATMMCQGWARQYNLPIWVIRPYSVYGNGEREHRLFPRLLKAFTQDESMTLYQGYHDFIYIDDFVRGVDLVLNHWDLPPGEIINLGSGRQTSNFELLDVWESVTGKTAPVAKVAELSKAFETDMWVCDLHKSHKLGFECEFDLATGIIHLLMKAEK